MQTGQIEERNYPSRGEATRLPPLPDIGDTCPLRPLCSLEAQERRRVAVSILSAQSPAGGSGGSLAVPPWCRSCCCSAAAPASPGPRGQGEWSAPHVPHRMCFLRLSALEKELSVKRPGSEKLCGLGRKSLKTILVQNHREMGSGEENPAFPPCDALPAGVTHEGWRRHQAGQRLCFPRGQVQGAGDAKGEARLDSRPLAPSPPADPCQQSGFGLQL